AARQSGFLDSIPDAMLEKRSTIKVRSSGRSMMRAGGDSLAFGRGYGRAASRGGFGRDGEEAFSRPSPATRRPGNPVASFGSSRSDFAAEDESQDAPMYV